jgi:hypothetical protein
MTLGRPIQPLQLSQEERETLERWVRRPTSAQALSRQQSGVEMLVFAPFKIKVLSPIRFFGEPQMYRHEVSHHPHRARGAPNHLNNFAVIL